MPGKVYYTEEEKELLQELVRKYKNSIESKKSNAVSLQTKTKAWERLCFEYNSMPNVRPRDVKQLRKLWDNLKQKLKKRKAKEVRASMGTGKSAFSVNQKGADVSKRIVAGGGPPPTPAEQSSGQVEAIIPHLLERPNNVYDSNRTGQPAPGRPATVEAIVTSMVQEGDCANDGKPFFFFMRS